MMWHLIIRLERGIYQVRRQGTAIIYDATRRVEDIGRDDVLKVLHELYTPRPRIAARVSGSDPEPRQLEVLNARTLDRLPAKYLERVYNKKQEKKDLFQSRRTVDESHKTTAWAGPRGRDWHGYVEPADKCLGLGWGWGTGWGYRTPRAGRRVGLAGGSNALEIKIPWLK